MSLCHNASETGISESLRSSMCQCDPWCAWWCGAYWDVGRNGGHACAVRNAKLNSGVWRAASFVKRLILCRCRSGLQHTPDGPDAVDAIPDVGP